jgi:hypothetical protein
VGGAYVEAARTGKKPASATTAEQLSDAELEYALQQVDRPPIHAGAELPVPADAEVPYCDIAPPPVSSRWNRPPRRQLLHPTRKPAPRWPWLLVTAALFFVVIGVGVLAWTVQFGTDKKADDAKLAQEKQKAEEAKATEDKKKAEEARIAEEKKKAEEAKVAEEKPKAEIMTAEEKAGPDPFREFRNKAFDVPRYRYVSPLSGNTSQQKRFPLILLPRSPKCEISLVTSAKMLPDNWRIRLLMMPCSNGTSGKWDCIVEKPMGIGGQTQPITIASFWLDDKGFLSIKWGDANEKNAGLANAMRNCPLRVTMPDCDDAIIYLRKPATDSPITFAEFASKEQVARQCPVDDVPVDIPVQLEALVPLPAGLVESEMKEEKHQTCLFHTDADSGVCFRLHVEHKEREPNVVVTLTDQGAKCGDDSVYAHSIASHIEAKEKEKEARQKEKGEKDKSLKDEKDSKKRETISKEIAELDKQIDGLRNHIDKARRIEAAYRKLAEGGKLSYRVYLPIDKYKVDLIKAEQQEQPPDAAANHTP